MLKIRKLIVVLFEDKRFEFLMLSKEVMLARETKEDIGGIIHKKNFLAILHKKNYTGRITFRVLQ